MKLELTTNQVEILKQAIVFMQLELCDCQIKSIKQELQGDGECQNKVIEGARIIQNDLCNILSQLNGQSSCWRIFR